MLWNSGWSSLSSPLSHFMLCSFHPQILQKILSLLVLLSDPNFKQQVRKPTILGEDKHTKLLYFNYSNNLKQF